MVKTTPWRVVALTAASTLVVALIPWSAAPPADAAASTRIAVIGDFGSGEQPERDVADLVDSYDVEAVVTVGDNVYSSDSYPGTGFELIDEKVGQFYHQYMAPYLGEFGAGSPDGVNRFFPALGNHDWGNPGVDLLTCPNRQEPCSGPWFDFFDLPGNERYYDVRHGPIHTFVMDNDYSDPDGNRKDEKQAQWLKQQLAASTATYKVVIVHYPPYVSRRLGGVPAARWPFKEWGATAVISGNSHLYERLEVDGLPYFVNGLGGQSTGKKIKPENVLPESKVRYQDDYGAMIVDANNRRIRFRFISRTGDVIDTHEVPAPIRTEPFEVGSVDRRQRGPDQWRTVQLAGPYERPVVVMGTPSSNGAKPLVTRVRNVTSTSFEYQLDEWDYADGKHTAETVPYLVMEAGVHTIDGRVWRAGFVKGVTHEWKPRSLPVGAFGDSVIVLTQVVTHHGRRAVVPRLRSVTADGFDVKVQEQEAADGTHLKERVAFIATSATSGATMGVHMLQGGVVNGADEAITSLALGFSRQPLLFAQVATFNGSDPVAVRLQSADPSLIELWLQEERSADRETRHQGEQVRWLAIES